MYNQTMKRYFIGIGSNINPRENLPRALAALLEIIPVVTVSRVIETMPVGLDTDLIFLNCAASFVSEMDEDILKPLFNQIEITLGRDRSDPNSKNKDRPADIDFLFSISVELDCAPAEDLPPESYLRPQTIELVVHQGISCGILLNTFPSGIPLSVNGQAFGTQVVTLKR